MSSYFFCTDGGYETVPDGEGSARLDPSSVCSPPRNEHGYEQVIKRLKLLRQIRFSFFEDKYKVNLFLTPKRCCYFAYHFNNAFAQRVGLDLTLYKMCYLSKFSPC